MQIATMQATEAIASSDEGAGHLLKPMKPPLDPAVCQKAARYAVRVYEEMSKRSKLLKEPQGTSVAWFDSEEVLPYLGELLGKGGFNNVYELERVKLLKVCAETQTLRNRIVVTKPKLAVKFLSDDALQSPENACNGSADLLMEAKYLTALASHPHPSLIQLHGISSAGAAGFGKPERAGFFLIIDRLYDTLDRRLEVWEELQRRKTASMAPNSAKPIDLVAAKKYLKVLFLQRLMVAVDICSAIQHLHSLSIVFRDLKPDNIGFDYEGKVKIFDFGLAKELDPKQRTESGLYKMSGGTGSRRFMAPEVASSQPYSLSADLYSFGVLVWEILALEKAYGRMPIDYHRERVVLGHERPRMQPDWTSSLQDILHACWAGDPLKRPEAKDVHKMLRKEIHDMVERDFPARKVDERRKMG
jgi:serine/threonine protein kinase